MATLPEYVPNWNSPTPRSGWFAFDMDIAAGESAPHFYAVVQGTGYALVRALQYKLLSSAFPARNAYTIDGPVAASNTWRSGNIDFGPVTIDTQWGPVTNAALWRFVANRCGQSFSTAPRQSEFNPITLQYLNAIERCVVERRINPRALAAAMWATYFSDKPWATFMRREPPAVVLFRTGQTGSIIMPPWDRSPVLPTTPAASLDMEWTGYVEGDTGDPISINGPPPGSSPGRGSGPLRPGDTPPGGTSPISNTALIVGGVLVGLGGLVIASRQMRRPAPRAGKRR